jgi:hypothetical protein
VYQKISAMTQGGGGVNQKSLKKFTNFENLLHPGQPVKPKGGGVHPRCKKGTVVGLQWYCIGYTDHLQ